MPEFELRISMTMVKIGDDSDEVAASSERSYDVGDASPEHVVKAVTHAGQSFAHFVEGVQKIGLNDERSRI